MGGLNYEANNEVACLKINNVESNDIDLVRPNWSNVGYNSFERIEGRCRHTSCGYNDKIFTFGGCYKFNSKR